MQRTLYEEVIGKSGKNFYKLKDIYNQDQHIASRKFSSHLVENSSTRDREHVVQTSLVDDDVCDENTAGSSSMQNNNVGRTKVAFEKSNQLK